MSTPVCIANAVADALGVPEISTKTVWAIGSMEWLAEQKEAG
jgi:hypothetical protein